MSRPCPPQAGDYFLTRPLPTTIRCRAYDAPPRVGGRLLNTIEPGTYLGPVEEVSVTADFTTILVRGVWVNVWARTRGGVQYARQVDPMTVEYWVGLGWRDGYNDP